jgi:hypothetical protein
VRLPSLTNSIIHYILDVCIIQPSTPPASKWQANLDTVLLQLPPSNRLGGNIQRYAAVLLMVNQEYYYQGSYTFTPYIIKAKEWNILQAMVNGDKQVINDLLEKNQEWINFGEDLYSQVNPAGCLNLAPEAINLLQFLQQYARSFGRTSTYVTYLPLLAQLQIPVFLAKKSRNNLQGRVKILPHPMDIEIVLSREHGNFVLKTGVKDESVELIKGI